MLLLTKAIRKKMEENHRRVWGGESFILTDVADELSGNIEPVVKLFYPAGSATYLLSEISGDIAFGLCDLGHGSPELGNVSMDELERFHGKFGLGFERDRWFRPTGKTMNEYAQESRAVGHIVA